MRALLERWAELEPAWCGVDDERASVMTDVGGPLERPRFTAQFHRLGQYEPHILASVIEAIEAREGIWDYRLAWRMAPTGEHFGVVKVTREDGWEKSWSCYAGSPAAALLGAYLAALEAEAGQ